MRLGQLLEGVAITGINGDRDVEVQGIAYDSRRVRPGDLFVAVRGHARITSYNVCYTKLLRTLAAGSGPPSPCTFNTSRKFRNIE